MKDKHEILVVDDMRDYREMLSLILQEKGYKVHTASCISEVIKIIKSEAIEIVVTDLIMKEETGIECVLTGFSGGSRYQPVVRYQKVHAYIDDLNLEKAIDYLGLKKVESGANTIFIIPYNDCVKYESKMQKNNMVASPVQLYLDCMSIKGRGEEMAEAILEREICK